MIETSIWFSNPRHKQLSDTTTSSLLQDRGSSLPDRERDCALPAHGFGSERQGKEAWAAAEASFWRGSREYVDDECRYWTESDEYIDLGAVALMRRIGSEAFMRRCASATMDVGGSATTQSGDSEPPFRKPGLGKRALSLCTSFSLSKKKLDTDSAVTDSAEEYEEEGDEWSESLTKDTPPSNDEYCPKSWTGSRGGWRWKSNDMSGVFNLSVFSELGKRFGRLY